MITTVNTAYASTELQFLKQLIVDLLFVSSRYRATGWRRSIRRLLCRGSVSARDDQVNDDAALWRHSTGLSDPGFVCCPATPI